MPTYTCDILKPSGDSVPVYQMNKVFVKVHAFEANGDRKVPFKVFARLGANELGAPPQMPPVGGAMGFVELGRIPNTQCYANCLTALNGMPTNGCFVQAVAYFQIIGNQFAPVPHQLPFANSATDANQCPPPNSMTCP